MGTTVARAVAAAWPIATCGACRSNLQLAMTAHGKPHAVPRLAVGCHGSCRHGVPQEVKLVCTRGRRGVSRGVPPTYAPPGRQISCACQG